MSVVNSKNVRHGVKAKLAAGPFQSQVIKWQKSDMETERSGGKLSNTRTVPHGGKSYCQPPPLTTLHAARRPDGPMLLKASTNEMLSLFVQTDRFRSLAGGKQSRCFIQRGKRFTTKRQLLWVYENVDVTEKSAL